MAGLMERYLHLYGLAYGTYRGFMQNLPKSMGAMSLYPQIDEITTDKKV